MRNAREGTRGTPAIYRYNVANDRSTALTGAGYADPSWSRDGRFVAATKTNSFGTDVVILDARTGVELLRVTRRRALVQPGLVAEGRRGRVLPAWSTGSSTCTWSPLDRHRARLDGGRAARR